MNRRVNSRYQLKNFIAYVLLYSPDRYPVRDFVPTDEQMTLDVAFDILVDSLQYVQNSFDNEGMADLRKRLDDIRQLYKAGEKIKAAHQLQDFDQIVFPDRFAAR